MITGGIDLGVVGTANLSAILAAKFLIGYVPPGAPPQVVLPYIIIAVLIALATGLACGYVAGILISRFNIPAILATLGTQQLFTGIAVGITNGRPQSRCPSCTRRSATRSSLTSFPSPSSSSSRSRLACGFMLSRDPLWGLHLHLWDQRQGRPKYAGLNNASITSASTWSRGSSRPSPD